MNDNYTLNQMAAEAEQAAEEIVYVKPEIFVVISPDNMTASLELREAGTHTLAPLEEDIRAALEEAGVAFGIKEAVIAQILRRTVYNQPVTIAEGIPNGKGENGSLQYLIRTEKDLRPKIREDGTADFKDLGVVQNVVAGQELCRIIPPTKGPDGTNVRGEVIPGESGHPAPFPSGRNAELNKEGTAIVATCDGNAEVVDGKILVLDILRIEGNVDNSTGNVFFTGDVIVDGDVRPGFVVVGENITVKGSVEGASLRAKNNITINQGVNGTNRGKLIAGGDVKCPYIQAANIQAGGNVYADSVLYCILNITGNLELTGRRAALIGGRVTVGTAVIAKSIGADSGATTEVIMRGVYDENSPDLVELRQEIETLRADLAKVSHVLAKYDPAVTRRTSAGMDDETRHKINVLEKHHAMKEIQLEGTESKLSSLVNAKEAEGRAKNYIQCTKTIFPGVRISFGPYAMVTTSPIVRCRIYVLEGEIKISNL